MEGPSISVFFLLILCGEFELCFQRDFFVVGSLVGGQKKFYERFKKKYVQQLRGKCGALASIMDLDPPVSSDNSQHEET